MKLAYGSVYTHINKRQELVYARLTLRHSALSTIATRRHAYAYHD